MASQNNHNSKPNSQQEESTDVHGRTHNSQNPAYEDAGSQEDISSIDQQEGNLKHGETGGHELDKDRQKTG